MVASDAIPVVGMFDLGMQILKLLAVLGGATIGALLGGLLVRACTKLSLRRNVPTPALRTVQALGAGALGLAVWMWVFGSGGSGFGGSGSTGTGSGNHPSASGPTASTPPAKQPATTPPAQEPAPPEVVRVEMLGGEGVQEKRFYLLDGDKEARNLTDIRTALRERRDKGKGGLKGIEIVIYHNSVAKDHPAVRELERWARENDLNVNMSFPKRDVP